MLSCFLSLFIKDIICLFYDLGVVFNEYLFGLQEEEEAINEALREGK